MTSNILIQVEKATVQYLGKATFQQLNFTWEKGQHWAITADSGLELTAFLETLLGTTHLPDGHVVRPFSEDYIRTKTEQGSVNSFRDLIAYVSQQYRFRNKSNLQNFYFQQRFNSAESEQAATVREYLEENSPQIPGPWSLERVAELLRLNTLLDSSILKLSNGETRRLALALGLLRQPKIFLMDQPMTGLDQESRAAFGDFLQAIIREEIHVLITTSSREIPAGITHLAYLNSIGIGNTWTSEFFPEVHGGLAPPSWDWNLLKTFLPKNKENKGPIVQLRDVTIQYGDKRILNQLNWEIKDGERWLLKGPNGSGKSTLISLLIGENPQAYSQHIVLFGRKRGSGESIWDVKRPIGFVAPELTRFFPSNQTCRKVVLSGFFDTMGLFKKTTPDQESKADQWLGLFQLEEVKDQPISRLSLGQQRWTLLARALIKAPSLLILDEASQGLDDLQRALFKLTIEKICESTSMAIVFVSHYASDIPEQVSKTLDLGILKTEKSPNQ
ncbi:ATP-binding cassette domain-containing protein [Algoriphagus litoralis]|uniref:ATP-binding cassette domain-containing protein n=1 Tax=Algoriphagus litoralis TaxID=2202829 RepID=UPI000DBA2838|nr:ATP-binding cassette domain-containing protein [Algoriphagus litoralis]